MYEEYWGLDESPFENVPDPRFMYHSPQHDEALSRMIYAAKRRKGAAMLTGEIGCGKTLLSRAFIEHFSEEKYQLALLPYPNFTPIDFLKEVVYQLGVKESSDSKPELLHLLNAKITENLKKGIDTLIIVDEAQVIEDATYEELRLLLNLQLNDRFLLTIIFLGQPELRQRVKMMPQLDQRIAVRYHISHFNLQYTIYYIMFRLRTAGMKRNVFTRGSVTRIHEHTGGVPRMINTICDLALLVGASLGKKIIDDELISKVINDSAG